LYKYGNLTTWQFSTLNPGYTWWISCRINSMNNYLQLSPLLHTAGSPTPQDMRDLRASGVTVVINLALTSSPDILPDEAALVSQLGMKYIHIPVEWEAPTRQNAEDFFDAMEAYHEQILLIHCVKNMRVSAFIFLYRVLRLGWTEENARCDLLKIWEPDPTWGDFIEKMLMLIS
jgi:protein tyrosine phosphatase (PTP) superfamily phosphohydrolase (DUF442 family)